VSGGWRRPAAGRSRRPGSANRLQQGAIGAAPVVLALALGALLGLDALPARSAASAGAVGLDLVGQIGGVVRAVVFDGEAAWVAEGIGVTRVDLREPERARAGVHLTLGLEADVFSLALAGRHLFVGARDGLHVLDVGNPQEPAPVAYMAVGGTVRGLTTYAAPDGGPTLLFVSDDQAGVHILDVSDGDRPQVVATVPSLEGALAAVATDGRIAAVPGDVLHVVSLAVPGAPVDLGRFDTEAAIRGLAVDGSIVYVTDSSEGLIVLSIADPTSPEEIARLPRAGAGPLVLDEDVLFVVQDGVRAIDVSVPEAPQDLGVYASLSGAVDVRRAGSLLLAARGFGLSVARLGAPDREPTLVSEVRSVWPLRAMDPVGDHLYVARVEHGLAAVDARDPSRMRLSVEWTRPVYGLRASAGFAYLSTDRGFEIWNVAEPAAPYRQMEEPFAPGWGPTAWIDASARRLVAATYDSLHVAELRPEALPRVAAELRYVEQAGWPEDAHGRDVVLLGDHLAYVALGPAGIAVVDLVDASLPQALRRVPVPGDLEAISLAQRGALLAVGAVGGVVLYDLTTPLRPRYLGELAGGAPLRALEMAFLGDLLLVAADRDGLLVVDLSDPAVPTIVGRLTPGYSITGVTTSGRRAYVAGAGLLVLEAATVPPASATTSPVPSATALPVVPTATPAERTPVPSPSSTPVGTSSPTVTATDAPPETASATPVGSAFLPHASAWRDP